MKTTLLILFALINFVGFVFFGIDKLKSVRERRRISEKTLIKVSVFAGLGAFLGMAVFRHKIRKPKFYLTVPLFLALSAAELVFIIRL